MWLAGAAVALAVAFGACNTPLIGSYNGNSNVSGFHNFASETSTPAQVYMDYLDGTSFSSECSGHDTPLFNIAGQLGSATLELSVPLPGEHQGDGNYNAALLEGNAFAPSQWEQCFRNLGTELVADGFPNAIIRLMWEPDSGIYSNDNMNAATTFALDWQTAHTAAMSVSGAKFTWAWYFGGNYDDATNNTAYPGNAYVDYVTYDQYDQSWTGACGLAYDGSNWNTTQSNCVWSNDISNALGRMDSFASAHGKPVGIGEFGVINRGDGHGGGDDPQFLVNFNAWVTNSSNNVAWLTYFNFNSGGDSILSDFPNSLAKFKSLTW